jgi:predicted tellurium resistance membrane protein TerC
VANTLVRLTFFLQEERINEHAWIVCPCGGILLFIGVSCRGRDESGRKWLVNVKIISIFIFFLSETKQKR